MFGKIKKFFCSDSSERSNVSVQSSLPIREIITKSHKEGNASAILPYLNEIADSDDLMSVMIIYGHVSDVFFINSKKMSEEIYQRKILDLYHKDVKYRNLIHGLFKHRSADIKLEIWETLIVDERHHYHVYFFFRDLKKRSSSKWAELVAFCHEKKFSAVPLSWNLPEYVEMQKELFEH